MRSKRQLTVLLVVFVLGVASLGTFTYLKFKRYRECREAIEALKRDKAAAEADMRQIPLLRAQVKAISDQVDLYAEILPKEQEVQHEAFVETMDRFARDVGLAILRADPVITDKKKTTPRKGKKKKGDEQSGAREPAFVEHSYLFELVGSFPNFLRFLNKIETWDRFLAVKEIDIRPIGTGERGPSRINEKHIAAAQKSLKSIQLVVTTYTYKPKKKSTGGIRKL